MGQDTLSQVIHPPEFYVGYGEIGLTHWSEFSTKDSPMLIGVAGPGRLLGFDWKRHTIFERSVKELQVSP